MFRLGELSFWGDLPWNDQICLGLQIKVTEKYLDFLLSQSPYIGKKIRDFKKFLKTILKRFILKHWAMTGTKKIGFWYERGWT